MVERVAAGDVRVLIVHPYRHVGGPDTFVTNLVSCLMPRGFQFWVLAAESRPLVDSLRGLGATVIVEPSLCTLPRTLSPVRAASFVRSIRRAARVARNVVDREGIGIVHGVHETMWAVLTGLQAGIGRVVSVHGLRFARPAWAGRVNTALLSAAADRILCVSQTVQDVFLGWGVPPPKLVLVRSSVDLARFRPELTGAAFRREWRIPADAPLIGTLGSVDERKGHMFFVEACASLHKRFPSVQFAIVGHTEDGPRGQREYLNRLRARAAALGLDGSLAFVPARQDVPEVLAAFDVLVQPSLTEAGPRAPLEAMAMQRPVVGTRIEGTAEEVVDGETGLLVPPRDAAALAEAIAALLDNPTQRAEMGRAGRRRVEHLYSLGATADSVADLYRTIARMPA